MRSVILLLILTAIAQASTFQGDNERTGNYVATTIIPKVEWKTQLSGLIGAQPVYSEGKIFVSNWYGWGEWSPGLYAINASSGEIIWRIEKIQGASTPAVYGGKVYVGGMNYSGEGWYYYGYFYVVNATSGEIEKELFLDQKKSYYGIASSPVVYNGSVYVLTHTNATLWKISLEGEIIKNFSSGGEINPYTSPAISNGKIYIAGNKSGENKIYCLNEDLEELWNVSVDLRVTNTPTVAEVNGERLVLFATEKALYIYNESSALKKSFSINGSLSSAAVANGKAFIGSKDGKLYCINLTSFEECWNLTANGKIDSSPAVANGIVYFATNTEKGTIYAVDATNEKILWQYKLIPPEFASYNIMSSPFIANNKLYIGADDGNLYCFGSAGVIELNVTLSPGKYLEIADGKEYLVNKTSALGALQFASSETKIDGATISFSYELSNTSWGLYLTSIMGLEEKFWLYYVNDEMAMLSIDKFELKDGDRVQLIYTDDFNVTPQNASTMIVINVKIVPISINEVFATSGKIGGNITAFVNVTAIEGWYVLVLSGLCDSEAIAGISTFYASGALRVPVLVPVPQQIKPGNCKLYAGVYRIEEYPEKIIAWSNAIEVRVE
ncbi:MAG: PQQ-binding-like beta-propeller repeat protein [Archaeoglobaceae archaeon]